MFVHCKLKKKKKKSRSFELPCNFVAQRLAGYDGNLLTHPLVGVEVAAQTGVVLLDDDPGGLLHCLGPDPPLKRNQPDKQRKHVIS